MINIQHYFAQAPCHLCLYIDEDLGCIVASQRRIRIIMCTYMQGLVGIVASQMYMRKANRVTLLESEVDEMRSVFAKFADDEEA